MKNINRFAADIVVAVLLAGAFIVPVYGQLPLAEGPTKERTMSEDERDLEERIAYQRMLATMAPKLKKKRDPKLALAELQEDFKRIQAVNLDMVRTLSKGGTLDLEFVADSAAEIKKRAERLKENLALPAVEEREKPSQPEAEMTLDQLKRSMLALGKLVYAFVKSPFFKEIDVVNEQEGLKVRRNLNEIIELSDRIKKNSKNLRKATRKE